MAKDTAKKPVRKKTAAKKVAAGKTAVKKEAPAKPKKLVRKKKNVPFERTHKLIICRKLPSTGIVQYWQWGNRWSIDKETAHNFERDFDAAQAMVKHSISHGKVIENRGK